MVCTEDDDKLHVVEGRGAHSPELGVGLAAPLIVDMRAHQAPESGGGVQRGAVDGRLGGVLIDDSGQLLGVGRIDQAGAGRPAGLCLAIAAQRLGRRIPVRTVFQHQRSVHPGDKLTDLRE